MTASLPSLLIAAIAFAIAFGIAKLLSVRKRRRDATKHEEMQNETQSRQVRRARNRRNSR